MPDESLEGKEENEYSGPQKYLGEMKKIMSYVPLIYCTSQITSSGGVWR
jgi:hypothetical protein